MSGVPDICFHNISLGNKQKDYCKEKAKKTTAYPSTVSCTTIAIGPDSIPSSSEHISSVTRLVWWRANAFLGWPYLTSSSSSNSNCELSPTYKASSDSASGRGKAWPIHLHKWVCMALMSSWRIHGRYASQVARNRLYVTVWVSDLILHVGHSLLHVGYSLNLSTDDSYLNSSDLSGSTYTLIFQVLRQCLMVDATKHIKTSLIDWKKSLSYPV